MDWKRIARWYLLPLAVLAVAALIVYAKSLHNDFVVWDDDSLVYRNPLTQHFTMSNIGGAFTSYDPELYVPLTILSFQIEHLFFGFVPFFYHADNLLLHIINAFLVFLFLAKLGLRRSTAFLGALLFAVHPINTEAVAWVSARKDLLSTLFSLSALLAYLDFRMRGEKRLLWVTGVLFLFALLCKPVAIVLPIAFLFVDWLLSPQKDKENIHPISKAWIGASFALSGMFLLIGLYGKQRNIAAVTVWQTLLLAIKSTAFSLQKFFWPSGLTSIYLQTDPISLFLPQFWIPAVLLSALALLSILSLKKSKVPLFSFTFFLIFLLPSFTNFARDHDIYFSSDRYIYLAQVAILFLLGYGWDRLTKTLKAQRSIVILWIVASPVLFISAVAAHAQSLLWKDSETLYRDALSKNDRSVVMHYNLGLLEQKRGQRDAAMAEYQKALSIDPKYVKALSNIGILQSDEGKTDDAIKTLQFAISDDPLFPEAHNALGSILMSRGNINGAVAEFRAAIAADDRFAQAHINLAAALGKQGNFDEGLREYAKAFALAPELFDNLPDVKRILESLPQQE